MPSCAPGDYTFTPLAADDILAIVELEKQCFPTPWSEEQYKLVLAAGGCRLFGVRCNGGLVGYLAVAMQPGSGEIEIYNIAITDSMRRRGLARKLLATALAAAAQTGVEQAVLEVRRDNVAAIALYESLGFTRIGLRPRYYQDTGEDALVYGLTLTTATRCDNAAGEKVPFPFSET